jgi:putative phage-type endonuclease
MTKIHLSSSVSLVRPWGIGGSDIGAIVGLSPYRSALDVWLDKVGRADTTGDGGAIHLRFGQHLEPFIAREYECVTGNVTHEHPKTVFHPEYPQLFAHVDRLVSGAGQSVVGPDGETCATTLLECKTASAYMSEHWGREWTDEVPAAYLAQCAWYMALTGCRESHIAVLIGNSDFRVYRVLRDEELERTLINAALEFWSNNVIANVPPQPSTRKEVVKLYPREVKGQELEADDALLCQLRQLGRAQRLLKKLEARSSELGEALAVRMGEAERICWRGKTLATWRASAPSQRLDVPRLRRERPELLKEYGVEGTPSRRLVLSEVGHA